MSEQTHGRRHDDDPEPVDPPATTAASAQQSDDFDDLLDEIDSVLENNAEDFVRSFVQKGGE